MNAAVLMKHLQEIPNPSATDVVVGAGFDGSIETFDTSDVESGGIDLADAGEAAVVGEDAV